MRTIMWILWPSFLAAGFASGVVFALVDPRDIPLFGIFAYPVSWPMLPDFSSSG